MTTTHFKYKCSSCGKAVEARDLGVNLLNHELYHFVRAFQMCGPVTASAVAFSHGAVAPWHRPLSHGKLAP